MSAALLLAPLAALVITLAATPVMRVLAVRFGFTDRPNPRRDTVLKPRLGGVAIFMGFAGAVLLFYPAMEGRTAEEILKVSGLLAGGVVVLLGGVLDDRFDLSAGVQLFFQLLGAAIAMSSGILIQMVTNPLGTETSNSLLQFPVWFSIGFTLFWLAGAMNTVNFLDGIDGLAAGIVAVAALILALHTVILGQFTIAVLPLALLGACLGFLPYNFYPSRITMGTSGSVFLGYALATLAVIGGTKAATLLLVLGLPLVDTGWTILRRLASGRSPFSGDRGHLHHMLTEIGLSPRQIVLLMYGSSLGLGALALVLSTRLSKLLALGIMTAVTLLLVGALTYAGRKRLTAK